MSNDEHKGEGNILTLGETVSADHGIILIIGREPNNNLPTAIRIDQYGHQWGAGRLGKVAFWNISYSLCGKITGHSCAALKLLCAKSAGCSPIAYADLSPLSLDGYWTSPQKIKARKTVTEALYRTHIDGIFSHDAFMKRVKLVICAGHKDCGLDTGIPVLESRLDKAGIPYCHIDSFNSTQVSVEQRLKQMSKKSKIVESVFDEFFNRYLSESAQTG